MAALSAAPVIGDVDLTLMIDVEHRPDGWAIHLEDRARDGRLLDGKGAPLAPGLPRVVLSFRPYRVTDFGAVDFGKPVTVATETTAGEIVAVWQETEQ